MSASKTKWVRLGEYIELCEERNSGGRYTIDDVRGISTDKKFIPTKANMNGVSVSSYKVVAPFMFAYVADTSRRGNKIALALNSSEESYLVSSIYTVFKTCEHLLPQYLYMLLNRTEFDRYSRFNSWGSAREIFDWNEFCRMEIPLPSISIQRELVDTYNGLKSLAQDNEALIAPLTQACEALVVDCKRKYDEVTLGEYVELCDERNSEGKYMVDDVRGISTDKKFIPTKANMDGVSVSSYKVVAPFMFAYVADTSRRGDKIALALNSSEDSYLVSSIYTVFKMCEHLLPQYLYMHLGRTEFDRYSRFNSWGSARETFDWSELCRVKIPLPPPDVQQSIVNLYHCIEKAKRIAAEARERMRALCPALIQKAIHS
jgi:hypothetical protein